MFRAILVDDEKPMLDLLRIMLKRSGQVEIVGSYQCTEQAFESISQEVPDVVFLDIDMSVMNGIELAELIADAKIPSEVIFVTAYDSYALEAFRVNAIDYILKPYSVEDVTNALSKLKKVKPEPSSDEVSKGQVRIQTFGRLALMGSGSEEPVAWRTTKTEELFAYFLSNLDHFIGKRRIVEAVWPEIESDKQVTTNLHTSIYRIKKTLTKAEIDFELVYKNGSYCMSLRDARIDSVEFLRLMDEADLNPDTALNYYKQAIKLYNGHYLGEYDYEWTGLLAERYAVRYLAAILALSDAAIAEGDLVSAESYLLEAYSLSSLSDDLNMKIMKLYGLKKDKTALVAHFGEMAKNYKRELDIVPGKALQTYYKRMLAEL